MSTYELSMELECWIIEDNMELKLPRLSQVYNETSLEMECCIASTFSGFSF